MTVISGDTAFSASYVCASRLDPQAGHPFDRVHKQWCGSAVDAVRSDELTNERLTVARWCCDCFGELRHVLVQSVPDRQEPATGGQEIVEVNGPVLVFCEFRYDDRQHRTADNAGLDEGARVQAHNRGAVKYRIEVVGTSVFIDRIAAPHDGVQLRKVD